MFTVNNKGTQTTPLPSFLILHSFHTLFLALSSLLSTGTSLLGRMILEKKPLKINVFSHLILQLLTFMLRYI